LPELERPEHVRDVNATRSNAHVRDVNATRSNAHVRDVNATRSDTKATAGNVQATNWDTNPT